VLVSGKSGHLASPGILAAAKELPPELQDLLTAGILQPTGDADEYSIDPLDHRQRSWLGWVDVFYTLRIDEGEDGRPDYEIVEGTREHGDDTVLCSPDPDEVACWISEMVEGKEE
jgi:hypothetical protein